MLLSHTPCTVMSMTSLEQFQEYDICLNSSSLITLSTNSTVKQMCNSMLFIITNLSIIYHYYLHLSHLLQDNYFQACEFENIFFILIRNLGKDIHIHYEIYKHM